MEHAALWHFNIQLVYFYSFHFLLKTIRHSILHYLVYENFCDQWI